jgi:hypothetical protein
MMGAAIAALVWAGERLTPLPARSSA